MIKHKQATFLGDIPAEWETIQLRQALADQLPGDWGEDRGDVEAKVIRSTNFTNDGALDLSDVATRYLSAQKASALQLKANDLLLERSGGGPTQPVGRIGFVEQHLPGFAFSNFVQLLRPDEQVIDPEYLGWVLHQVNRSGLVERLQHQTTQLRNLDYRDYLCMILPKPSQGEQQQIARLLNAADKAIARTRDEVEAARRLKTALMQQLLTKGMPGRHSSLTATKWLTMPSTWKAETLGNLADIRSGFTMGRDLSRYTRVSLPYVTVINVQEGFFDLSAISTAEVKESELEAVTLRPGDVLMTEGGDRDKLGRGAIWEGQIDPCAYQNHIFRIRFRDDTYNPRLFHFLLQAWATKRYFYAHAKQTSNLCTINSRELKRYPIGIPEPGEQDQMLELLDSMNAAIQALTNRHLSELDLKASLLQNLLTGKVRIPMEATP